MTNGTDRADDTFDFAGPPPVAPRPHAVPVAVAVGVVLLVIVAGVAVWALRRPGPATAAGGAPNILVIMADDMPLREMRYLPNVEKLLLRQGTQFSNFYTTTSNCCPSRGGYYTGQYPHNTGVRDNLPPLGGANSFIGRENDALAPWLHQAGYYTAHLGKYLNGWGDPTPPDNWTEGIKAQPGWDRWFTLIDPTTYSYFDYDVSVDGVRKSYGSAPTDYQTDVLGQEAIDTMKRGQSIGKPWFVDFDPIAPHVGSRTKNTGKGGEAGLSSLFPIPPPRYEGRFATEPLYRKPSQAFGASAADNADLAGKPGYVRNRVKQNPTTEKYVTDAYRAELDTALGLDDWVGKFDDYLHQSGQADNTVVVFWSDNGLFHGEHGLIQKGLLYEEAVHQPLVMRGPGIPAGKTADQPALNLDLTATILRLAHATPTRPLDGRDLVTLANQPEIGKDRALLLEYWYTYSNVTTKEVRLGNWAYMKWSTGETELYDLATDPNQVHNVAADPAYKPVITDLTPRLATLATCNGATCEDSDASRHEIP